MLKNDLVLRSPMRFWEPNGLALLPDGGFGVVAARAGVGKTAFLVQLALNALLRPVNVLHISLDDPVSKVSLWYKEMFRHLVERRDDESTRGIWDELLAHRLIMTFKVEGFSVPKLEERLGDLVEQKIFTPKLLLVDGLPFGPSCRELLTRMKALATRASVHAWFAVTIHRHQAPGPDGLPVQLADVADLFDVVVQLQPDAASVHVKLLKGGLPGANAKPLVLDPSTMLLMENA